MSLDKKEAINKFLTEKFLGKCWHEWIHKDSYWDDILSERVEELECTKCKEEAKYEGYQYNLFTPTGFFLLWEKAQGEEWWDSFLDHIIILNEDQDDTYILSVVVNPLTFPTLLAEYLGWKETTND